MRNDSGHKQNAPAQLKMEGEKTNDIFPYRTHTMQMQMPLLMQRTPLLLLYPKESRGKKNEKKRRRREKRKREEEEK
jgi:hypothetical protein